jgi:hypothetical protein
MLEIVEQDILSETMLMKSLWARSFLTILCEIVSGRTHLKPKSKECLISRDQKERPSSCLLIINQGRTKYFALSIARIFLFIFHYIRCFPLRIIRSSPAGSHGI